VELAAVVAVPDAYLGERSCAFLVGGPRATAAELRAFLTERGMAAYKLPDRVQWLDDLPRTAVGKIDKRALRAIAARPTQESTAPVVRRSEAEHP
jgi:2,3-dihydroxybenzoate-AMP ligase